MSFMSFDFWNDWAGGMANAHDTPEAVARTLK